MDIVYNPLRSWTDGRHQWTYRCFQRAGIETFHHVILRLSRDHYAIRNAYKARQYLHLKFPSTSRLIQTFSSYIHVRTWPYVRHDLVVDQADLMGTYIHTYTHTHTHTHKARGRGLFRIMFRIQPRWDNYTKQDCNLPIQLLRRNNLQLSRLWIHYIR